jgi:hypothetical protein
MQISQILHSGKRKYRLILILLSFLTTICVFLSITNRDEFDIARREVLIRRIGHEILLQSGDSTSRVLPVIKISDNEYQLQFEKEFTFQTDSLVNTIQRLLAKDHFANEYVVNVLNCGNSSVTYGFAISENKKNDIVACLKRTQPSACYKINIKFKPSGISTTSSNYLLGGLLFLALAVIVFLKSIKSKRAVTKMDDHKTFNLGSVLFDVEKKQLLINNTSIDLTGTETRLLRIFASAPNEIIARSRLQKEIWEDEGVIVGRSLDMFISKLRKKLEPDPSISIVVIRSKGYRLEV